MIFIKVKKCSEESEIRQTDIKIVKIWKTILIKMPMEMISQNLKETIS